MKRNIPSNDDFERAYAAMNRRSRGLSLVRDRILEQFKSTGVLHEFFILDCSEHSFHAYVFYPLEKDIREAIDSGVDAQIRNTVYRELENVDRGDRNKIEVEFEWSSHDDVERRYGADYFNRLR